MGLKREGYVSLNILTHMVLDIVSYFIYLFLLDFFRSRNLTSVLKIVYGISVLFDTSNMKCSSILTLQVQSRQR